VSEEQLYSLKWNPNPPLSIAQLVTFAVASGVGIVLSWLGVIAVPGSAVGMSALYVAMGFLVPFCLWFSGWGLVIATLAGIIGAGILSGMPLGVALLFGPVDMVSCLPILIAYRWLAPKFGLDPLGRDAYTPKGFGFFFLVVSVITRIVSATYGIGVLYLFGLVPPDALPISLLGWFLGDMIVTVVIAPILMRALGPVVERQGLTVRGVWS
jgi:hypothetical protein